MILVNELNKKEPLLKFFEYDHLPDELAVASKPFLELAITLIKNLPSNSERTMAVRKLLEAKDCAVRSVLYR